MTKQSRITERTELFKFTEAVGRKRNDMRGGGGNFKARKQNESNL